MNIDSGSVIKGKTVRCFISRQLLSVVCELEGILVQSTSFGKDGENNSQCALVSQREVGFFASVVVSEEDCDRFVSSWRSG